MQEDILIFTLSNKVKLLEVCYGEFLQISLPFAGVSMFCNFCNLKTCFSPNLCASNAPPSRPSRTACASCGTCRTGWRQRRLRGSRWDRRSWTGFCAPMPAGRMRKAPAAGARRKRKRRATIRWAGGFYSCSCWQLASLSSIRVRVACVDTRPPPVDNYVFSRLISFSFWKQMKIRASGVFVQHLHGMNSEVKGGITLHCGF